MTRKLASQNERRRIAVLTAAASGVTLPFTGFAVHASSAAGHPQGWPIVHTVVGAVFVLATVYHSVANRRALARYVRGTGSVGVSRDASISPRGDSQTPPRGGRSGTTRTTAHVVLDRSRCQACWRCVEECSRSVIGKVDVLGHRHATISDADSCVGCGRCIAVCSAGALTRRQATPEPT